MYSKANKNIGLSTNISVEPSANTQSSQHITNNIIVKGTENEPVVIERSIELSKEQQVSAPVLEEPVNESVDSILLGIYQSILLKQNKTLLANILSKKHIIIYKEDLEKVISAKIGKKVSVVLHDFDSCGCVSNNSPFATIESIVVYEDNHFDSTGAKTIRRVDFHVGYNADFVELTEKYALSLKVVCV